jgi:hypothetical protein
VSILAFRSWLAVLALGALSACAGLTAVQPANITAAYDPQVMNYIASRGGLPTEITGNPFDAPDEQVYSVVRKTMAASHFGPDFPFLAEKPQGSTSPYRMVVVLGSKPGTAYSRLCAGVETPSGPKPKGGELRVSAALCARDEMITSTAGRVSGVTGPDDPTFVSLISQIALVLFPPVDENSRDNREIIIP